MTTPVKAIKVLKVNGQQSAITPDLVVTEEPLEIRVGHGPEREREQFSLSVTMRTPGNDEALSVGFLFSEGIIDSMQEVISVKYCEDLGRSEEKDNVMRVELVPGREISDEQFKRHFYTSSSCGVCGKASIESIQVSCAPLADNNFNLEPELLYEFSQKLRAAQQVFEHTGGLHAAALFDAQGELITFQEDVGRHNALDKLLGQRLIEGKHDFSNYCLMLSGRVSFELVQKALRAGIPMIAAVGAPSSLAVELAKEFGLTLIGFLKADRFNVYSRKEEIG